MKCEKNKIMNNNNEEKNWIPLIEEEELLLRQMLWLSHGCPISALYGDDGEMHCGSCMIDFKRMKPSVIIQIRQKLIRQKLAIEKLKNT